MLTALKQMYKLVFPAFCLVFTIFSMPLVLSAQKLHHAGNGPEKKVRLWYGKGRTAFEKKEWNVAEKFWTRALQADSLFTQCHLDLGALYLNSREWEKSRMQFEKAFHLEPNLPGNFRMSWGLSLWETSHYEDCEKVLRVLLEDPNNSEALKFKAAKYHRDARFRSHHNRSCGSAVRLLPVPINTINPEYFPILSPDQQDMYFTRREAGQEDFYHVSKLPDGQWADPAYYHALNSEFNEGAIAFSADGNTALLVRCGQSDPPGGCDLFESFRNAEGWTAPINMGPIINSEHWDSQPTLSADGRLLFFTSNRPGGYGGKDLWYAKKNRKNLWDPPVNAGPAINTAYDDISPYLHPDGVHLYFASAGHPGMGGVDVFVSEFKEDEWKTPVNLGTDINTAVDESCFTLAYDGTSALFNRIKADPATGRMLSDIYEVTLCPENQIAPMRWLTVKTYSARDSSEIRPVIEVASLHPEKRRGLYRSQRSNRVKISMPEKEALSLHFYLPGYVFYSSHISEKEHAAGDTLVVFLQPIEKTQEEPSKPVVLNNIFFETGSASLTAASGAELDRMAEWLKANTGLRIRITGHTDNTGTPAFNLKLSKDRAAAVVSALIQRSIAPERLEAEGAGETKPVDTNTTDAGRAKNRRTEFQILN
jgi:outer membrane protein OmpA-like peptidoglycan-associated protein